MGTLKYAILGLLNRNEMTGYELSKEFETTLFEFWNAKHSQIYPELKSLNAEGLIQYRVEITGNVLEKKVYTITDEGRRDFSEWEETLCPIQTASKMNPACGSSSSTALRRIFSSVFLPTSFPASEASGTSAGKPEKV